VRKAANSNRKLFAFPIFYRIAIGNGLVIVIGAIVGVLVTRHLAVSAAADLWLIVVFAAIGVLISLGINCWIIEKALRPLHELKDWVNEQQPENPSTPSQLIMERDPDISQLAEALNSLIQQIEEKNCSLHALTARAIHAQEEERIRIARSLHDDTGQSLSTLVFKLEHLSQQVPEKEIELKSKIHSTYILASDTLNGLRKIVSGLRPSILDDLGLVPAIRWYARTNLENAGVLLNMEAPEVLSGLTPELTTTLFRIAQEGINNIVRHSQAQTASVILRQESKEIYLRIEDDGQGFNYNPDSGYNLNSQRWGLLGIRERVELVGGEVGIYSQPGSGTLLEIWIPLPVEEIGA
jgi:two-component system sensor histidine kinase UhpB